MYVSYDLVKGKNDIFKVVLHNSIQLLDVLGYLADGCDIYLTPPLQKNYYDKPYDKIT